VDKTFPARHSLPLPYPLSHACSLPPLLFPHARPSSPRRRRSISSSRNSRPSLSTPEASWWSFGAAGTLLEEPCVPEPLPRVRLLRPPLPASMESPSSLPRPSPPCQLPPGEHPVPLHLFPQLRSLSGVVLVRRRSTAAASALPFTGSTGCGPSAYMAC
jgi:hypothetical protein